MFDKKQKTGVKCIHLVTDDGLYDGKIFYKVKIVLYLLKCYLRFCGLINKSKLRKLQYILQTSLDPVFRT